MYNYYNIENLRPDEILVYLRKSRTDDPMLSVEEVLSKHETILDEWAEHNLGTIIAEENKYREIVSGETIADRPKIQTILKLIESPKIKAILTVEVQRLSRGDLEDCGRLIKLLRYTNTLVITPQKIYDLKDDYDRDAFERELKRGNEFLEYQKKIMNRGRLLSVSQGNYVGSEPPYGYNKIWIMEGKRKCPTLAINEEQATVIRMIFDLYVNKNWGRTKISRHLDEMGIKPPKGINWSPSALKDTLENVHYIGKVKWNWRKIVTIVENGEIKHTAPKQKMGDYLIYEGKHPAIISDELFQAARDKQGSNYRAKPTTKVRNPFASILYCKCGRIMNYQNYKSRGCLPRLACADQVHCKTGSCTYEEMVSLVGNILKASIEDFKIKSKQDDQDSRTLHESTIKLLQKRLNDIEARELSQWEAQSDPDPSKRMPQSIFTQLNAKLQKEKEETEKALHQAIDSMPPKPDYEARIAKFTEALTALESPVVDPIVKNKLLKDCIARIEYSRAKPERLLNKKKRAYHNASADDKDKRLSSAPLPVGSAWTNPPINIEVDLKV